MIRPPGFFMLCVVALGFTPGTFAQLEGGIGAATTGASPAAYYFISRPGEITMTINLWGYVRNPGRYEVPISTGLVELLSFAGGPLAEADLGSVKVARQVRRDGGVRTVEFRVNLDELEELDEKAVDLEPGDTVLLDRRGFSATDFFNIVSTAAIVTTAVATLVTAMRASR